MIRANILDYMCGSLKLARTAVVLTHNIDFLFVQSLLLPRLRKLGHPKLTVFADAACAAGSYQQQRGLVPALGQRYRTVPVDLGYGRRFHAKAIFLSGPGGASLSVGSGNLTHGGWSANREIWASFAFPGDGGPAIAALRDYLETVLDLVPDSGVLGEAVLEPFAAEAWAGDLPEPGQLLATPHATPLLTRMLAVAGDGVEAIDVLTPFFDPKGEALTAIATRTGKPVRALLQRGREGLTQDAAGRLPHQVSLASFEPVVDGKRAPFVHAKAFALRKADNVTLIAGSANCSQAALLADRTWGNAELMAVSDASTTEVDALFAEFVMLSQPPELPAHAPSESWASGKVPLRLLAARRTEARLDVHFKSSLPVTEVHLVSAEGEKFNATELVGDGHAVFSLTQPTAWVRLMAAVDGGGVITSDAMWVDDETALRASGPERQLREHLHDAAARDHLTSDEYLKILELFDQHVRQPVTRIVRRGDGKDRRPGVRLYRREDVFSADFGRAAPVNANSEYQDYRPQDTWALFLSFFQILQERDPAPPRRPTPSVDDDPGEGDGKKEGQKPRPSEARPRDLRPKVLKVVSRIEDAMSRPEFVDSRPPERLAADIGFAALLLTKAQHDGYLTADDFQGASGRLWKTLFFGSDGRSGAIPERISRLSAEERLEFADAMRSPRLSAAMTVWCLGKWRNEGQWSSWFRLSAALLAARLPWLTQGGAPEEIAKELNRVGQLLIPESETELFAIWRSWIRCGIATAALEEALSSRSGLELMRLCSRVQIADGELLWQANAFHTVVGPCRRDASSKALVCPLGRPDAQMKFQGHFLVPVRDLLDADLGLAPEVCQELGDLIEDGRPAGVAAGSLGHAL